ATAVTLTALGLLSEVLAPAARALSLPRWTATVFAVLALGGFAYAERGLWLTRSLWALEVVARAWRTVASSALGRRGPAFAPRRGAMLKDAPAKIGRSAAVATRRE